MATGNNKKKVKNKDKIELMYSNKLTEDEILNKSFSHKVNVLQKSKNSENILIHGENFNALHYLLNEKNLKGKVDLIYIDPPYGTNSTFLTRDNGHAYKDEITGTQYIEFLRERLILLRELLSEKGSIYIHLDENMAFPIKIIMDEIFSRDNFRNWITRIKSNNKNATRNRFGNISDYIMYYTKTKNFIWNRQFIPWDEESIKKEYPLIEYDTERRYKKVPIHAPGIRNGKTGGEWKGMLPPKGKHWQYSPEKLDEFNEKGEIVWSKNGNPRRKVYLDKSQGKPVQDIWDLKDAHHQSHKITGYPTEKNLDLLKRIVASSSNKGSIVLDCFAGSGTTLVAANELERSWIGIDASKIAIDTIRHRFINGSLPMGNYVDHNKSHAIQETFNFSNDYEKYDYTFIDIEPLN